MYFWQTLAKISLLNACHILIFHLKWIFLLKYGHIYICIFNCSFPMWAKIDEFLIFLLLGSKKKPCCIRNHFALNCDISREQCIWNAYFNLRRFLPHCSYPILLVQSVTDAQWLASKNGSHGWPNRPLLSWFSHWPSGSLVTWWAWLTLHTRASSWSLVGIT